jgi:hypothetical protein
LPQVLQFAASVEGSTHTEPPVPGQQISLESQELPHAPQFSAVVNCWQDPSQQVVPLGQAFPQAPQFALASRSVQTPEQHP